MFTGVCIPGVEHEPTSLKVLDLMEQYRIQVARVEVTPFVTDQQIANVVDQFSFRPALFPDFLIGAGKTGTNNYMDPTAPDSERRYEPHEVAGTGRRILDRVRALAADGFEQRCLFEPLNEGDIGTMLYKARPADYAEAAKQLYSALRNDGFTGTVLAGSISNLNDRGFKFLREMKWPSLPEDLVVNIHWYPDTGGLATSGHDGRNVEREWSELIRIVGSRKIAVTEFGFASMSGHSTQEQQAEETRKKLAFFAERGVVLACYYQINDGPNRKDFYDNLGLWDYPNQTPKPVVRVFAEFA